MGHLNGSVWCVKWNSGGRLGGGQKKAAHVVVESTAVEEISHREHVEKSKG